MTDKTLLIGDIGGTNARFALAGDGATGFTRARTLNCADFPSADDAIRHYLSDLSAPEPDVICLAAAGPLIGDSIKVTNNHWSLSTDAIARDFGIEPVILMNDFKAIAYAIPQLTSRDIESIGDAPAKDLAEGDFKLAIVGPGTGLGVAGLYRQDGRLIPIAGEGGHVGFAPRSQQQADILETLHTRFDVIPAERLVSGGGIENIYWALGVLHNDSGESLSAANIFRAASEGGNDRAVEATRLFLEILGQFAGDVALTFGAVDGVFIAGGIVKRYPALLHASGFRDAFENKGKYREMMEAIPTHLITYDEPGLLGAAICAQEASAT